MANMTLDLAGYFARIGYEGAAAPTASLVTADGRCNLAGRHLAIHRDGGTQKIELPDAAAVIDALTDRFGINVADTGERATLEARIAAVSA